MANSCIFSLKIVTLRFICTFCLYVTSTLGETKIEVSTPVNPAKEGGLLSVKCRVWNLRPKYVVSLTGPGLTLSFGDKVLEEENSRVFLAVKTLTDGSTVYFLSIINVARTDEGTYSCRVIDQGETFQEIIQDSRTIEIWYPPTQTSPGCSPHETFEVTENIPVTLNCSSKDANPAILIQWSTSTDDLLSDALQETHMGITTSHLTITPTIENQDAVYLCRVISRVFPDYKSSCYVGPIKVIRDLQATKESQNSDDGAPLDMDDASSTHSDDVPLDTPGVGRKCSTCPSTFTAMRYWILATAGSIFVAILLIMLDVILFVRLYQRRGVSESKRRNSSRTLQMIGDDIYVDLGERMDLNRVYMTLERPKKHTGMFNDDLTTSTIARFHEDVPTTHDRPYYMGTFLKHTESEPRFNEDFSTNPDRQYMGTFLRHPENESLE